MERMRKPILSALVCCSVMFCSRSTAQWTQINGSGILSFDCSISVGEAFLVSSSGAIQSSTDSGMSWSAVSPYIVTSFAYDGSMVYGARPTGYGEKSWVVRSSDNGSHWELANNGLPEYLFSGGIVCSKGNAIIGCGDGFYASTNQGTNWTKVTANVPPTLTVASIVASQDVALACAQGVGIFRSTDGGLAWNLITLDASLDLVLAKGQEFYATRNSEFYASLDSGATWILRTTNLPYNNSIITVGDTLYLGNITDSGVYRSTDDGVNWSTANSNLQDYRVLRLGKHKDWLFAGTMTSLFRARSTNVVWEPLPGSVWVDVNTVAHNQGVVFAGTACGLYRSTNEGSAWVLSNEGFPPLSQLVSAAPRVYGVAFKESFMFAAMGGYLVYRSSDNGKTWTPRSSGLEGADIYCIGASQDVVLAGAPDGHVFRSSNNGDNWISSNTGMRAGNVRAFCFSSGFAFAATDSGLHRSSNNGATWEPITFLSGLWSLYVEDVLAIGSKLYTATAGPNGGVYTSTDNGSSWVSSNSGLSSTSVNVVEQIREQLIACSDVGPYASYDGGASWTYIGTGLPNRMVLAIASDTTFAFAASEGYGVWRRPLSEIIATGLEEKEDVLPVRFSLEQNYPNPFNPSTTVRYGLPQRSSVTLAVFNTLGQKITTLVNETQEAGYHGVKFDGTNLASGVYFYRIQAGRFVQTKKLLLLR
jgi:photosystem II stability/assembly factor-like uncharacterized protein